MTEGLKSTALSGGYGDTTIISGVSLSVAPGQITGLFGRNGVGKTTLAKLVQGSLPATAGDIALGGTSVGTLPAHRRHALGLGYMPQTGMVFDDLTVRENLTLTGGSAPPDPYFDRFPRLRERLDQPAGTMSGGERKILAFVRTMIEHTAVLILDEPSEGVQQENIEHMAACLKARADAGAAIILIEQNLAFLTSVADQYLGLEGGRIVFDAPAQETSPQDLRAVLSI